MSLPVLVLLTGLPERCVRKLQPGFQRLVCLCLLGSIPPIRFGLLHLGLGLFDTDVVPLHLLPQGLDFGVLPLGVGQLVIPYFQFA